MASTGLLDLLQAARQTLIENDVLSDAGVFFGRAPREDDLPYLIYTVIPHPAYKSFDPGRDHMRVLTIQTRVCAAAQGGTEAPEIAQPLMDAAYECFTQDVASTTPQARLNAHLEPLGWTAGVPLEEMEIAPYADYLGDLERWNFVNRYSFRISRLA